jgi:hypothetical protein
MDEIMPEERTFPKFLPRLGARVRVTFGEPEGITRDVHAIIGEARNDLDSSKDPEAPTRVALTTVLQRAVKCLGDKLTTPT